MTFEEMVETVCRVRYPGWKFDVWIADGFRRPYLQASFMADNGPQKTRKWLLSYHMTPSEVVQTAFKCVLTGLEDEAREFFTYRGRSIFGPHFDVEALVDFVDQGPYALREEVV